MLEASREEIYDQKHNQGLSWSEIYELYPDIPESTIRGRCYDYERSLNTQTVPDVPPGSHKVEFTQSDTDATATSVSTRIKTLEQLLEAADVDLELWTVSHYTVNSWEQHSVLKGMKTLHQVKASLVPNKSSLIKELVSDLRKDMADFAPTYPPLPPPETKEELGDSYMLEISIPDLHYGKYAWMEASGETYNMGIAEEIFHFAVQSLIQRASKFNIEQIVFVVGNDLFNADNFMGTTFKGTPQQLHGMHQEHYRKVREMVRQEIDRLQLIAPVHVYVIPGNHDTETMYYFGESLYDWYINSDRVSVISSPMNRLYHRYGKVMLGFTHGDEIKEDRLPFLMASESVKDWSLSKYREWHTGHKHKKNEKVYVPVTEVKGVRVRIIPSLCAADKWHHDHGFVQALRCAEGYLWHKERGLEHQFTVGVDDKLTP